MSAPVTIHGGPVPAAFSDPAFRRRRTLNWLVLGLLYSFFYMSRYNFAAVMHHLSVQFGWTNTQLGVFETVMPLVYGLSVVLNGPIADRVGGKRAFLFGAVGAAVMNFAFGLGTLLVETPAVVQTVGHTTTVLTPATLRYGMTPGNALALMVGIWGLNGYFQSFGALSIVKVNAQWFHVRERGTFAGVFGVLIRLGLLLGFQVVPLLAAWLPLQWAFWIPGLCVALFFFLNLKFMNATPRDCGYGELDTGDEAPAADDGRPPPLSYLVRKVFANRATWTIAACSMMIGMVRRSTVDSWYPKFFAERFANGVDISQYVPYTLAVWGIALLGIAGGFVFGIASDRVYGGRRAPVIAFGFGGIATLLVLMGLSQQFALGPWPVALSLAALSFFVNGAHGMIGGAASMDFGGKKAAATAAGLFDGMQYLASSLVGIGMGYTLDTWGWSAWPWVPIPFALIGAALIATLWHATPAGARARAAVAESEEVEQSALAD